MKVNIKGKEKQVSDGAGKYLIKMGKAKEVKEEVKTKEDKQAYKTKKRTPKKTK